jgi:hypothetical protein
MLIVVLILALFGAFLVPTLTYRLLFAFVVLRHHRRELLHLHVTDHPTAVWTPAACRGVPVRFGSKVPAS